MRPCLLVVTMDCPFLGLELSQQKRGRSFEKFVMLEPRVTSWNVAMDLYLQFFMDVNMVPHAQRSILRPRSLCLAVENAYASTVSSATTVGQVRRSRWRAGRRQLHEWHRIRPVLPARWLLPGILFFVLIKRRLPCVTSSMFCCFGLKERYCSLIAGE